MAVEPPAVVERRIIDSRRSTEDGQSEQLDTILKELKELRKDLDEVRAKRNES
jgi:hypothetical protein